MSGLNLPCSTAPFPSDSWCLNLDTTWIGKVSEELQAAYPDCVGHHLGSISSGPVRVVVASCPSPRIGGVPRTLSQLGYTLQGRFDSWFVWVRGDARGQERLAPRLAICSLSQPAARSAASDACRRSLRRGPICKLFKRYLHKFPGTRSRRAGETDG